jgi:hypothetical protein
LLPYLALRFSILPVFCEFVVARHRHGSSSSRQNLEEEEEEEEEEEVFQNEK